MTQTIAPAAAASVPAAMPVESEPASLKQETDELARLIAGSAPDEAVRLRLDRAITRWPGIARLHLLRVDLLDAIGSTAEAEAELRALLERKPDNPWPARRLVVRLLAARRIEEARVVFTDLWHRRPPDEIAAPLLNQVTAAIVDPLARKPFLEALLDGTADDRFVLVKLATLAFRAHDRVGAMALLDRAVALGPLPAEGSVIHIDLLTVNGRLEEAADRARDLVAVYPDRPDIVRKAIQTADLCGRQEEVTALLVRSVETWPDDWLTLFRYNRASMPFALDRALFARLRERAAEGRRDDRWSFQLAVASLRHGDGARAFAILDAIGPDSPAASMALPLRAALDGRPREDWSNPRGLSNDPADDVQVRRRDDAVATCFVFAGVQGGLGYLPFSFTDTVFADYPFNMVYLRDAANFGFARGIASMGEGEAAMLGGLRGLVLALGDLPAITVGASLGGVAAARAGALTGAAAILSLAAPLTIEAKAEGASRFRMEAMSNTMGKREDLGDLIARVPDLRLYHCYGTGHAADRATADALRPLANATIVPVACDDHFPLQHMLATGAFGDLLLRIIAELPR